MWFGFQMPFACIMACTVVPYHAAMLESVSPKRTVWMHVHPHCPDCAVGAIDSGGAADAAPGNNAPSRVSTSMKASRVRRSGRNDAGKNFIVTTPFLDYETR